MFLQRLFNGFIAFTILLSLVWAQTVPYDPTAFDLIGNINGITLDPSGDVLAGGTITVDGLLITVPKNLLVTLPSITVAWSELFKNGVSNLPGTFEAHIQGNRVNNQFIAGIVYISQNAAQVVQGFITAIDLNTGHFTINGAPATAASPNGAGQNCVINDPVGRFGRPYTANPLWTSDPDNPSIHTQHGMPMCIPRSTSEDPLCPTKNRPLDAAGKPINVFTFKDPATITATDPDPRLGVPLLVGDYVSVSGTYLNGLLEVYSLNANLLFLTAPGTKPAYVSVEGVSYAIVDTLGGVAGETKATVFVSDPSVQLQWYAMDVDPCTGAVTERSIALMQCTAATAAPAGRCVYRMGKTDESPAPRQVLFRLSSGTTTLSNGIIAGQFVQPVFDYIFPELAAFGTNQFPNSFDLMPYLAKGSGPYVPGTFGATPPATPVIVGQLSPFPMAVAPAATSCPPPASSTASSAPASTVSSVPASSVVASPTSVVASPTSSAAPTSTVVPKDTITIVSASQGTVRGVTTVNASARSDNPNAVLTFSMVGPNPINNAAMTKDNTGLWSISVSVKNKGSSVTIKSQFGGSATRAI
ncbi:hypothetical protein BP5796_09207 [Coleophoma crateriformis]|uniref:Uncharacterized protein n=1 Tax=Coleophoma crateriformis TaxID=565419 RepID=A0A3D8R3L6_9HELO|nr:hypothetical protein BP5796_09207 [Coleophoma crateriformis]